MTKQQLQSLRKQITLCSSYTRDYRNDLGVDENDAYCFFDGYTSYLEELMQDAIPGYDDEQYFDYLPKFDNAETLWDWYNCFTDSDPLPVHEEVDEWFAA